jgi:hypothetical protein
MKVFEAVKITAIVVTGFVGVKIALAAKDKIDGGMEMVDAAIASAKETVKTVASAINPASPDNIVYKGVNTVAAQVTNDPSWNLGNKLWEFLNPDKVAKEKAMLAGGKPKISDASNLARQVELMELSQDKYRASEIEAQNAEALKQAEIESRMSNSRSSFRIQELSAAKGTDAAAVSGYFSGH